MKEILGIDVGGTGTKAAIVNIENGELLSERIKLKTPDSGKPEDMSKIIEELVDTFDWKNKITGMGFPSIIRNGICCSASNISKKWIGIDLDKHFRKLLSKKLVCINDADAAGLAEFHYGKGKEKEGTVILLTLGTGIGSALFRNGVLVPNTEFGNLHFKNNIAEKYASNKIRETKDMSWEEWGSRLNEYLQHIEFIFSPDLILLGGGVSKRIDNFREFIQIDTKLEAAKLRNKAGVIGAAKAAEIYFS
jgi:polyphosphate glucokinase